MTSPARTRPGRPFQAVVLQVDVLVVPVEPAARRPPGPRGCRSRSAGAGTRHRHPRPLWRGRSASPRPRGGASSARPTWPRYRPRPTPGRATDAPTTRPRHPSSSRTPDRGEAGEHDPGGAVVHGAVGAVGGEPVVGEVTPHLDFLHASHLVVRSPGWLACNESGGGGERHGGDPAVPASQHPRHPRGRMPGRTPRGRRS